MHIPAIFSIYVGKSMVTACKTLAIQRFIGIRICFFTIRPYVSGAGVSIILSIAACSDVPNRQEQ